MAPDNYDVAQAAVRIIPTFDRFDEELDSGIKAAMAQAPTPFVTIGAQVDKAEVAAAKDYIDAAFANPINVNVLATLVQASVIQALSELSAETDNGVKTPIEAYLDTTSVERALEEANEEVEKGVQSPLNFHLQTGSVEKALEEANAEAEKGIQSPLNFHLQTGSVEKSLSEADAEAEKGIQSPLDFHLQTGSVAKALAAAKAGAEKGVTAPLDANLRASSVAQALGEMAADLHRHFTVPIQATTKPLVEEVAAVETTLHGNAVTIPVKANVSEAVATALAAATAVEAATMGGGGGGGSIWAATAGASLGNLIYGVEGRSFLARLLSPLTMISTLFSANFGSLGSLAGFGPEHLLTTLLGLGGLATGGGLGALLLGSGALAKTAVGGGSDSLVSHEMLTNVKALISGTETLTAVIKKVGVTAGVAEDQLAKAWKGMEADFDKATGPAQAEVAGIGEQFVKLATDYIPLIAAAADKNFGIIANGLKPLFAWLEGPQGKGIFENLENEFSTELPTSMHAFDQGMELFLRVVNLASTYTGGLTKHINEWLTRMNGATFGKVRTEVGKLITDFHLVDTFIKTLGKDIVDIFKNDAGTATSILKLMTSALKELGHWINSISGGDQLKRLFTLHKGETLQLMQSLGELLVSFGKVYLAVAPDFVKLVTIVLKLANAFFTFTQRIPGVAELVAVGTGLFIMEEHSHTLTSAVRLLGDGFGFLRGSMNLLLHPISTIEGFFSRTFSATHMTTSEKMQSAAASMREAADQMSAAADQMTAAMGQVADSSEVTGQQMSVAMQGASGKTQAAWMEAQIAVEQSVDAQRAAMESLGDSDIQLADTFQSVVDRIIASGAEMDERVAAAMAEMDATLGETGARVAAAGTEMGAGMEVGADEVVAGTSIMDGALATLGGLMESLPMLAVFAGLTIGIEELITHWSAVVSFFKANETTILLSLAGLAAGFTALDIVMDANPVGIVIEAIAALGLAIYELYEHWETVYNFLKGPWGYLIAGFVFSFDPLIGIIILVGTHWQAVWGAMKEIVDDSWHAMDASWHEIESGAESLWSAMEGVAHDIESAWDDLVSFFENLPHYFEEAWDAVASFFESIPGKIERFFEDAGQWLLHVGSDIISGLIHGLEDGAKDIAHVVSDIGHDIVHVFSDILGIFSPSKVMTQQGHTVMAGMTQGIQGGSKETVEAATKAAKAILKAFGTLNKIKSDETTIKTVSTLLSSLTTALTKLLAFGDKTKALNFSQLKTNFDALSTALGKLPNILSALHTDFADIGSGVLKLLNGDLKKLDTFITHITTAFTKLLAFGDKTKTLDIAQLTTNFDALSTALGKLPNILSALHTDFADIGSGVLKLLNGDLKKLDTFITHITTAFTKLLAFGDKTKALNFSQLTTNFDALSTALGKLPNILSALHTDFADIGSGVLKLLNGDLKKLDTFITHITTAFTKLLAFGDKTKALNFSQLTTNFDALSTALGKLPNILSALHTDFADIGSGVLKSISGDLEKLDTVITHITTAFTKLLAFGDKTKALDIAQLKTNFDSLATALKQIHPLLTTLQQDLENIGVKTLNTVASDLAKLNTALKRISTALTTMANITKNATTVSVKAFMTQIDKLPAILKTLVPFLDQLRTSMKGLGGSDIQRVVQDLQHFGTVLSEFGKTIKTLATTVATVGKTTIPADFRVLQAAATNIANGLTATWKTIHSDASSKWATLETFFSQLPKKLEAPFKTIQTKFKTIGTQIATGLKDGVVSGESKVTKALTTALVTHMYKAGIEWVRGPSLGALGESVDTGIATGVSSHSGALGGAITTALDTMMATARSHIGAKSPALAFAGGVGKPIAQGIGLGLELGTPTALEAARRLLTQLLGMFGAVTLKSAASSMSSLKSLLSGMASALSNLVTLSGKVDTVKFTTLLTNFQTLYTAITRLTPKLAILWTELTHQVTATEITKINKALSPLVTLLNNVTSALAKLEQMSSKVDKIKFTVLVQNFGELVKAITRLTPKLSLLWTELTHQVTVTEITEINKALGPFVTLLGHVSSALTKLEQISSKADKINYQFLAHNFTILTIAIKDLVPHLSTLSTELTKTISTSEVTQLNKAITPFVTLLDHVSTALTKLVSISSNADKIDYKTLEANFSSLTTAIKDIIPHLHTLQTELSKGLGTIKVTQISKTLGPLVTLIGNVSSALTKFVTISSKVDQIKYTQIAHNMVELKTAIKALVPALGTIGTLLLKKLGPTEVTQLNKGLNPFLTLIGNLTSALTKLVSMSSSLVTIHFTALKLNLEALITAVKLAIPLIQKLEAMLIKFGLTKLTSGSTALGDLSSLLGSLSSALTAMHTITSTSVTAEDIGNVFTELSNLMTHIKSTLGADKNLTSLVKTMTALDNVFAHFSSVVTAMVTIGAKLGATTPKQLSAVAVAWTLVMKMIVAIPPKLIGAFTTLPTKFHGIGVTMMVGLANGIRAGESSVVNAAAAVVSAAVAAAKTAAIISSPSLLMAMEVGLPMGEGIAVGLLQSSGSVVAASKSLVHSAVVGANPSGALGAGGSGTFQPVVHVHVNGNANMSASDIAAAAQQGVVKGLMQVTAKTKQLGG